MKTKRKAEEIVDLLEAEYPDARCSLDYGKDYEFLFAVRLSAQCTDARVNLVTPALFSEFPTLEAFAGADREKLEEMIRSCGFFRSKAGDIISCAKVLLERYGGRVPGTMEELLKLPGVGRKTANLILGDVFDTPGSVTVDTHCIRLSNRIGFVDGEKDPVKIESVLREVIPPDRSNDFCHRLVMHGRAVCRASSPACDVCCLNQCCRFAAERIQKSNN